MPNTRWLWSGPAQRYRMLVSTPDSPVTTTLSSTRSARKPPNPDACQKMILDRKYSHAQITMVFL